MHAVCGESSIRRALGAVSPPSAPISVLEAVPSQFGQLQGRLSYGSKDSLSIFNASKLQSPSKTQNRLGRLVCKYEVQEEGESGEERITFCHGDKVDQGHSS